MIASIIDPTATLMLTQLTRGEDGRIHAGRRQDLRRRQRRYQRHARLRKLLG
jgi:hypothetical protein